MKASCISHLEREPLVIIRKSQVDFCEGSQCAAAIMSFFEYWHNWKLDSDQYNKKSNDTAEKHGDERILSENVYQFHTLSEISEGIMGLYSTKTISEAIKYLESKGVITTHQNPNPRYHYDKTKYFCFYPEVYNSWLRSRQSRCGNISASQPQKGSTDAEIFPHAAGKNAAPYRKISAAITEINNKEINQSITAPSILTNEVKNTESSDDKSIYFVQSVIDELVKQGFPVERFRYPDTVETVYALVKAGATRQIFLQALEIANKTSINGYGVNYLAKVVKRLLSRDAKKYDRALPLNDGRARTRNYQPDYKHGLDWMGDLIE